MAKVRVALGMTPPPALFTDLYELTMAAACHRAGRNPTATFSLFVRRLPPERGFLLAAGLAEVLEYLMALRFTPEALRWLESLGRFEPAFLDRLAELRFAGEVRAMPEGTAVFAEEPILEVTAPLIEAQLVETAVINLVHLPTLIASRPPPAIGSPGFASHAEICLPRIPRCEAS
jgi:nicotinate phosphoribosyltransferase